MPRRPTIIVYGATAFTAGPLLPYLDTHPDGEEFDFILAGRTKSKLDAANAKLTTKRKVVALDLKDKEGVRGLVEMGDVVMNLAGSHSSSRPGRNLMKSEGPFQRHNAEALIKVCAETGKHYVDLSAETTWLASIIIPKYDFLASRTGACIVPSCGFDSVHSDLTLYHALRQLQSVKPGAGIRKSTSFFKIRGTFSGGTIQTLLDMSAIPRAERGGEWSLISPASAQHVSPPFRFLYTLENPSLPRTLVGSFFFMYPYNRCIVRRSWWLSRVSSSTFSESNQEAEDTGEPRHGEELVYEESMQFPNRIMAGIFSSMVFGFVGLFFASSLIRRFVTWMLPPGAGAPIEKLKQGSLKITNISVSDTTPPIEVLTIVNGEGDPGYLNTCYTLAESALALILASPKGTSQPPLGKVGGVLTPSTAMGMVLVERLRRSGKVTMHSEVLDGKVDRERRKDR